MKPRVDPEETLRHLDLLDLTLHELRCIKLADGRIHRGWFSDREELAQNAAGLSGETKGTDVLGGAYVTVNELDPFFHQLVGELMGTGPSTKAEHVIRLRNLVADIDPNKVEGEPKQPATEAVHAAVLDALQTVKAIHLEYGLPEPALINSGNGGYPISRIDLETSVESEAIVQRYFAALAKLVNNQFCHVDEGVFDAGRIFRLAGTINRKGVESGDRVYRATRVISAPDKLELITKEQLIAFTDKVLGSGFVPPVTIEPDGAACLSKDDFERRVAAVAEWLKRAGRKDLEIKPKAKCTAINFVNGCAFKDPGHKGAGGAGVVIWKDGRLVFSCLHEKCLPRTFADLQDKLGLKFQKVAEEFATTELYGDTKRVFCDPNLIAEKHLHKWKKDGAQTLAHFRNETYRYDATGWQFVQNGELDPWILDTAQKSFDEHAAIVTKLTGEETKPMPIRGGLVEDSFKQMKSICRHEIARDAQAPFWLGQHEWNPADIFVFRNGVLNIRRFIEGQSDYWIPPTARLFFLHAAQFDFNEKAGKPERWLSFMASLGQPPEWHRALQEIIGYSIWSGLDYQKYFQMLGPRRAGKGIVSGVMKGMQGGEHSVCALDLEDFATAFGLEDAIDKRLAIIPEARLPKQGITKVVSRLKAVTGGDVISVNRKKRKQVSVRLQIKIVLQSNEFLVLPDSSGALHARTYPLKFVKSFFGQEDAALAETLVLEYPSIFLWALDGIRSLLANGGKFTMPESTLEELEQLHSESIPLQAFFDDCCALDAKRGCHSTSLYEIYRVWHAENNAGDDCLADNLFSDQLKQVAPSIAKARLNKPGDTSVKGYEIVNTAYDNTKTKASVWLKIVPKPEWRMRKIAA